MYSVDLQGKSGIVFGVATLPAPLRRNITHEEVAKAALFLCSDLSSGITGTVLPVDAGYHIMAV